uniref:Uncharacterized protein n=1 Tax=Anguilla anguilla TaxID=7936 RepID=A0A0E9WN83_ANGAN
MHTMQNKYTVPHYIRNWLLILVCSQTYLLIDKFTFCNVPCEKTFFHTFT